MKEEEDKRLAEERGEKEDFRPISEKALDLVQGNCSELFTDQFGSPYAAIKIGEHIEILPLKSPRFKNWLCKIYYDT